MRNNGQLIMNVFVEDNKISWFQLPCQHPAQITFVCAEKPVIDSLLFDASFKFLGVSILPIASLLY